MLSKYSNSILPDIILAQGKCSNTLMNEIGLITNEKSAYLFHNFFLRIHQHTYSYKCPEDPHKLHRFGRGMKYIHSGRLNEETITLTKIKTRIVDRITKTMPTVIVFAIVNIIYFASIHYTLC